jgi:hypothetical protein
VEKQSIGEQELTYHQTSTAATAAAAITTFSSASDGILKQERYTREDTNEIYER